MVELTGEVLWGDVDCIGKPDQVCNTKTFHPKSARNTSSLVKACKYVQTTQQKHANQSLLRPRTRVKAPDDWYRSGEYGDICDEVYTKANHIHDLERITMTAWNGFVPVKTKRDTVTQDRNDDGTILDDGEDSK